MWFPSGNMHQSRCGISYSTRSCSVPLQHDPGYDDNVSMIRALQISGDITYNGEPLANFYPQRTAAYVDQVRSDPGLTSPHLTQHC